MQLSVCEERCCNAVFRMLIRLADVGQDLILYKWLSAHNWNFCCRILLTFSAFPLYSTIIPTKKSTSLQRLCTSYMKMICWGTKLGNLLQPYCLFMDAHVCQGIHVCVYFKCISVSILQGFIKSFLKPKRKTDTWKLWIFASSRKVYTKRFKLHAVCIMWPVTKFRWDSFWLSLNNSFFLPLLQSRDQLWIPGAPHSTHESLDCISV